MYSDLHLKKHMKVRHEVKDKLLWVGDSVSSNMDFDSLALDLDMDIKSVKAYSVTAESVGARFPSKNFLDVVEKELEKKNCETHYRVEGLRVLILQSRLLLRFWLKVY